ncbi:hypothetical protein Dimus_029041, partial [Dionaea muscipula]
MRPGLYYILIASEDAQLYGLYPNVNSSQSIVRELRAQLKPPSLQLSLENNSNTKNLASGSSSYWWCSQKKEDLIIVNIDEASGDDELAVAEYAEDIYKFYKLTK